jgi:hypothetical protein
MKKISLLLVLTALFSAALSASSAYVDDSAGVSGKFSTIDIGAAASGMGNAYLGASNDSSSIFWNPAGLSAMKKNETEWNMFFAHNMWLMTSSIEDISIAKNVKNIGVFGVALSYFTTGDMDRYGLDYASNPVDLKSTFSAYSLMASIAYSNTLDKNLDFGVVLKYVYDSIDSSPANALAFDLGLRYYLEAVKGLSFNLVARNMGGQLGTYVMDKEIAFATLYTIDIENWTATIDYDLVGKIRNDAVQRVGIELKTPYLAILRAGYFTDNTITDEGFRNFTFGAGINIDKKYHVDFSFEPYGILGNAYKVSFGADF